MQQQRIQYVCPKCGCRSYEQETIHTTGGTLARMFDVQNKRFVAVSCRQCGYTELYKANSATGLNVLDFLMNG